MFRTAVMLSVVTGLLLCPLRCIGVFDGSAAASEPMSSCGCDHCSQSPTDPQPAKEKTPSDDCGCEQCFCKGCVVESTQRVAVELSFAVDPWGAPSEIVNLPSLCEHFPVRVNLRDTFGSGRMLRITLQSMLL
jgi:hypothetical protein